jgi:hypothetical protein
VLLFLEREFMVKEIIEKTPYFFSKQDVGYILTDLYGYAVEADTLIDIGSELIKAGKKYKKVIEEYNIKRKKQSEEEMNNYKYSKPQPKPKPKLHIYFIKCGEYYKIGISKDVQRRMKELDKRPYKIETIYVSDLTPNAYKVEQKIHSALERYRINGEWYNLPDGIIELVCKTIKAGAEM